MWRATDAGSRQSPCRLVMLVFTSCSTQLTCLSLWHEGWLKWAFCCFCGSQIKMYKYNFRMLSIFIWTYRFTSINSTSQTNYILHIAMKWLHSKSTIAVWCCYQCIICVHRCSSINSTSQRNYIHTHWNDVFESNFKNSSFMSFQSMTCTDRFTSLNVTSQINYITYCNETLFLTVINCSWMGCFDDSVLYVPLSENK